MSQTAINVTLQAYPVVPRDRGVLRATPAAANTANEVTHWVQAIIRVHRALGLIR